MVSELIHTTVVSSVVSCGRMTTDNAALSPALSSPVPVIFISVIGFFTVTVQLSCIFPSSVSTVITALPAPLAVTTPSCDTSATPLSEDVQITFLLAAFSGSTSAVSCSLCCQFSSNACLFNFTAVTAVSGSATLFVNALILKFVLLVFP